MQDDLRYAHDSYTVRRKVLTIVGAKFHVFDPHGELVRFSKQKAFRLKEDIRVFADEAMTAELLALRARNIVDFGATYDVVDSVNDEAVGSLRRRGMKSLLRDEWALFDVDGTEIAAIKEDSAGLAALRRVHDAFALLAPQVFNVEMDGRTIATYRQNRNPFVHKLMVDFLDGADALDRRLGLAAAILICAVEGRQG